MNSKTPFLLLFILLAGLSACQKASDLVPTVLTTNINVINAGADTLNFYQNGTRVNNLSSFYPGGLSGYLPVTAGAQNYQLKKAGHPDALIDLPLTLTQAKLYSLFVAGQSADKVFLVKDSVITDDKARIRFVNASPTANKYDVYIGSGFAYTNRAFKSATDMVVVNAGTNLLTIYPSGSLTPVISLNLSLAAGNTYTLYIKGTTGGSGDNAFAVKLITK